MKKLELRKLIREEIKSILNESFKPEEIIRQLGGRKFIAMTGAKQFVKDVPKKTIVFKIGGGAKNGINYIRIKLNGKDLYDIEFIKIRGTNIKVVKEVKDIYNDQLQDIFTQYTGFETYL